MQKKTAAELMEQFIKEGFYQEKRTLEHKDTLIKETLKERLQDSDSKRHEFKKQGIVAKFVPKKISEVDYPALNEYLYDLGLLIPIIKLDHKKVKKNLFLAEQVSSYQFEPSTFVKPSFNKVGKSYTAPSPFEVDHWKDGELAATYADLQSQIRETKEKYEWLKNQMIACPELAEKKKVKHTYGSVSLQSNDPLYDVELIAAELGEEILIQHGQPDSKKLEEYILKGSINKADLDEFKTVKDIRLDFVVMTIESENKMLDMLSRRHRTTAINQLRA